jgi:tetratricopeptide (TPR) repeat protein
MRVVTAIFLLLACLAAARADTPIVTAVFSKTGRGYERKRLPDGTFKREYFVIANGRYLPGAAKDDSIDRVRFPQIAGLIGEYLARQNYFLAPKAEDADFLLLISWGTSIPFSDARRSDQLGNLATAMGNSREAMANYRRALDASRQMQGQTSTVGRELAEAEAAAYQANDVLDSQLMQSQAAENARDKVTERNARLLGYVEELDNRNNASRFAGAGAAYDDLLSDLETERYFVIVTALDFRKLTKENKQVVLWSTRVSIEAHRNRFDQALETMVASAGRYFGQNSGGLERKPQEGRVTLGELKFLGVTEDPKAKPETPAEAKK